jgi:hypothetical protein
MTYVVVVVVGATHTCPGTVERAWGGTLCDMMPWSTGMTTTHAVQKTIDRPSRGTYVDGVVGGGAGGVHTIGTDAGDVQRASITKRLYSLRITENRCESLRIAENR